MKLLYALASLLTATFLPSVFSTRISHNAREVGLVGKTPRVRRAITGTHVLRTSVERFSSSTRRNCPVPLTTYQGYIEVHATDGSRPGYLDARGGTQYGYTPDHSVKLIVSFSLPTGQTSGSGLNLLTQNSQLSSASVAPYLGFASPGSDPATQSFAYLTSVAQTSNTPSSGASGTSSPYIESCVWSVDVSTGKMKVGWTNSQGSVTFLSVLDDSGDIMISGAFSDWFNHLFVPI